MCTCIHGAGTETVVTRSAGRRPRHNSPEGRAVVRRAFTLIELLIVVSIIVVLIGILLPSLGAARNRARRSQTQALLSNLASDIDAYYTRFHAYPGPMNATCTTTTTTVGTKISGAQNMLMGLSYPLAASGLMLPTGGIALDNIYHFVNVTTPTGPVDMASMKPDGTFEQLPPYFTPANGQIGYATGVLGTPANTFAFPVVFDPFPDGLPVLYFRRTPGVEIPVAKIDPNTPTSGPAGYYVNENIEYTQATALTSTSGMVYNETAASFGIPELTNIVSSAGGPARGGYVLISAGIDRYYGTYNRKTDDIVQVGGD